MHTQYFLLAIDCDKAFAEIASCTISKIADVHTGLLLFFFTIGKVSSFPYLSVAGTSYSP